MTDTITYAASSEYILFVIFMVPGFIAVKLFLYFSFYEKTVSSFNTAYYSLTIGAVAYFGAHSAWNLQSNDVLWVFAGTVVTLSIGAIVFGWMKRKLVSKGMVRNSAWDNFVRREVGTYVRVKTMDGSNIYGWLKSASTDAHKNHDIVINDPYIWRDGKEQKIGKSMFVNSSAIAHILILDSDLLK